jgi:protein-disulfide isomerase
MTTPSKKTSSSAGRRDRREAARKDARLRGAATAPPTPFWKSPIFLMTVGALVVGAAIIGFWALSSNKGSGSTATVQTPLVFTPTAQADGPALGAKDAIVTVDIWSDFQCPACDSFAKSTLIDVTKKYVPTGQVRFVDHAIWFIGQTQGNEESLNAGAAAECAGQQNQYWPYHDYLFENQGKENGGWVTRGLLDGIATKIGLDASKFASCYDGGTQHTVVKDNTASAEKVPVQGTPTLVINGTPIDSKYVPTADQLSAEIDKAIVAAGGTPPGSPAASAAASPSASTAP